MSVVSSPPVEVALRPADPSAADVSIVRSDLVHSEPTGPLGALRRCLPRISADSYVRILTVALALLAVIIVTGAIVRLTGSGLGCPEWPTCSTGGVFNAPDWQAKIELGNRYLTGVIAFVVVALGLASLLRDPYRPDLVRLALFLFVGVVGQAILGGMVVLLGLAPQVVMGHFLLSILLVTVALVLRHRATEDVATKRVFGTDRALAVPAALRTWGRVQMVLALGVVVSGTVVTSSGPHGGDLDVERFPFTMQNVSRIHTAWVWALLAVTLMMAWRVRGRVGRGEAVLGRRLTTMLVVVVAQGAVGYSQYLLLTPRGNRLFSNASWVAEAQTVLVGFHIAGAAALWFAVMGVWLVQHRPAVSAIPAAA